MIRILAAGLLAALPAVAAAQDKIGTGTVNGAQVDLFNDNTWAWTEEAASGCQTLTPHLKFCGDLATWKPQPSPNQFINAQYLLTDLLFAQYVSEPLGTRDGLTRASMRQAILQNAANATGERPEDIEIVFEGAATVDGFEAGVIAYTYSFNSVDFVMLNTYGVRQDWSFQIMAFEGFQNTLTDALRGAHAEFTDLTELSD